MQAIVNFIKVKEEKKKKEEEEEKIKAAKKREPGYLPPFIKWKKKIEEDLEERALT